MSVAKVYRRQLDWRGDPLETEYLGDIHDVIIGGAVPQELSRFPGLVSTEGQVGIPFEQDSGILVQKADVLVINNVAYTVVGPRQWDEDHTFAGTDVVDELYWVQVEASHGRPQ
ncbi:head-to-tail stopper [Mycobacterium phage Wildcat]|uniref:Head-to-tail stopper n=4 Tax=Mycobacterium virus Wildcat TaxID=1993859 RepID=Q19Y28_9CAUD|nr:head-tail connector protein [Mycobacterium phage Wildcat]AJD82104.1 head-to-tail stopper [Mycobacterium phage Cosmo]AQT25704.1 head-to-tail stopper [Mycobacterium phage EniyanLRS]QGJ89922.1 head-to-tail stopper [Mycobacterium phage MaryV]WKR36042.1 head-tail connector protein [Mycobacterium phage Azrael100]ABE67637.1 head-to-tail stopper [Mycobacterium phage Wildcat]